MDTHLLDAKGALQHYLQEARDPILWKLDGLGERDLRLPRTPTGTNLPDLDWAAYTSRLTRVAESF